MSDTKHAPPHPITPDSPSTTTPLEATAAQPSDGDIVRLLWERSDEALAVIERQYSRWLFGLCQNILDCAEDSEECVNDTLLAVWNTIPPDEPQNLRAYMGRVARNIALNRWQKNRAAKRSSGPAVLLSELEECLPDLSSVPDDDLRYRELIAHINAYLHTLDTDCRIIFARRYWYADPIPAIAADLSVSPRTVSQKLFRMRKGLKKYLTDKGVYI